MTGAHWSVPRTEADVPAFVLGGGSSLIGFDAARLIGKGMIIAVNDAGLHLAPFADVLYFADGLNRWLGWNRDKLHLFQGDWLVTRADVPQIDTRIRILKNDPRSALSYAPDAISGFCGGSNAINLAYLFGCNPIYLLGFDMRPGHWHDNHQLPAKDKYASHFIPSIERMAVELKKSRVQVFNCNPASALRCFPLADIDEVLA